MFCFPFLQRFVVAAFGFDDFASVRTLVDLYLARLTGAGFGINGWSATARLWIKQVDHVFQAVAILTLLPPSKAVVGKIRLHRRLTRPCHSRPDQHTLRYSRARPLLVRLLLDRQRLGGTRGASGRHRHPPL